MGETVTNWRKSSASANGESCVEVASTWRKSSASANGETCVEVASTDTVRVRDTTDRGGVTLSMSASAWQAFTASLR